MQGIVVRFEMLSMPEISSQEFAEKWEVQLRKGCVELAILGSLWGESLYGLEILRRLESDSDLVVSEGTMYPLLRRLKNLRLVKVSGSNPILDIPGKYYALTSAGRRRALEMAAIWGHFT